MREHVAGRYPDALVMYAPLKVEPGRSFSFFLEGAPDPATAKALELPNDQIFVNPYTGEVLGERKYGDIAQGTKNLMPFVYRLHYSLALDPLGSYLMGIVALLWTVDCFLGAYLTFPARRRTCESGPHPRSLHARREGGESRSWLARWWPSWKVRWNGSSYKVNFDLHRAGGLWPWAMLFVIAWSSVAFNLSEVYNPVMRAAFMHQPDDEALPKLAREKPVPGIAWNEAREVGRRLMHAESRARGFDVLEEEALRYDAQTGLYRYSARSSADVRERNGNTQVHFNAATGAVRLFWLPTGAAGGDTITTWLTSLHMAALWGVPFKLFICVLGPAVAMLSVTGVIIWSRKRSARRGRLPSATPTPASTGSPIHHTEVTAPDPERMGLSDPVPVRNPKNQRERKRLPRDKPQGQ